jgi:hypothetical protein
MDYARCPECELPAEVVERFPLQSTDGPIVHVRIGCFAGHVLTPAADDVPFLDAAPEVAPDARPAFRRYAIDRRR